jgi:hypothetical protein
MLEEKMWKREIVCCLCVMQDLSYLEADGWRWNNIYEAFASGIWRGGNMG